MQLSIVIPSYNRNASVSNTVRKLVPQLRNGVELRILDNHSAVPIIESLRRDGLDPEKNGFHVFRNAVNLGAYANILRSFEVASGEFLWILGDDDEVSETAVDDILKVTSENPDTVFFNFSSDVEVANGTRLHAFDTVGQAEFVEKLDAPGNVNFMSVSVWRTKAFVGFLNIAYHYTYSMSPTFVLLLASLGNAGRCHFSSLVLVQTVNKTESKGRWRLRDFVLGWNLILELPMSPTTRAGLAKKMMSWHSPENVCVFMLADAAHHERSGRLFRLISLRLSPYVSWFARFRYFVYRLLFITPRLSWRFVKAIIRLAVFLHIKGVDLKEIDERSKFGSNERH